MSAEGRRDYPSVAYLLLIRERPRPSEETSQMISGHRVMPIDLPLGCPHYSIHELRKTPRTVGMSKKAIGRSHAMCLSVRPLCNPAFTINRRSGLVSKESAHTADGN